MWPFNSPSDRDAHVRKTPPGKPVDGGRRDRKVATIVALLTFATFSLSLTGRFLAWDDQANFLDNPFFRGFSTENLRWMWTTHLLGHYVPLSWTSLAIDYELWGMNPAGYHLTTVLLHTLNAVGAFYILLALLGAANENKKRPELPLWGAAFGALLFAVHPLRVESVAWITERRDVLSLSLAMGSTLAFFESQRRPDRRWYYVLSIVLFAAALLAKASVVALPVVLLLVGFYPMRWVVRDGRVDKTSLRRLLFWLAPFFVLALVAGMNSVVVLEPGPQLSAGNKIGLTLYALGFYITKTVLPSGLSPLYEMPTTFHALDPRYFPSYVVAIAALVGTAIIAKRRPGIAVAVLAFIAISLPMLGIVQNGPALAADRYTYHSGIALAALGGAAFLAWPRSTRRLITIGGIALAALTVLTLKQSTYWHDSTALWSRIIEIDETSAIAHNGLGVELAEQGNSRAAIDEYTRALQLNHRYADPHNNLGFELAKAGRADEAVSEFRAALAIQPRLADAELNWGNVLYSERQFGGASAHYERAVELEPTHAGAHFDWAMALVAENRKSDAILQLETAAKLDPNDTDTQRALDDLKAEAPATRE